MFTVIHLVGALIMALVANEWVFTAMRIFCMGVAVSLTSICCFKSSLVVFSTSPGLHSSPTRSRFSVLQNVRFQEH